MSLYFIVRYYGITFSEIYRIVFRGIDKKRDYNSIIIVCQNKMSSYHDCCGVFIL